MICRLHVTALNPFWRFPVEVRDGRFELHVCGDSAEFLWDVLLDAGKEFGLKPAGVDFAN